MKVLLRKEIKSLFCSSSALLFSFVFLITLGLMLWFFTGRYNIIDGGYATLDSFFYLAPILLAILIPALTMKQVAEEKAKKTFDLITIRPQSLWSVYTSKYLACALLVALVISSTCIYIYSIYMLSNPVGNIDLWVIGVSYLSLFGMASLFIVVGLFTSSITHNQAVAYILGVGICFVLYWGFALLSTLTLSGVAANFMTSLGVQYHFQQLQRGVVELDNILTLLFYHLLFVGSTLCVLRQKKRKYAITFSALLVFIGILMCIAPNPRIDMTADKKYTLNELSVQLLKNVNNKPLAISIYLTGNLNSEFQYLRNAIDNTLSDFKKYAPDIETNYTNPYLLHASLDAMYTAMEKQGMTGILLNEVDREGKTSQKVIYPYAEIVSADREIIIPLLKNIEGYTASENINASIENLEFELISGIRLLNSVDKPKHIAFIEGNGELSRTNVQDAEEILSRYFVVNRGEISNDLEMLKNMDALIIAGTTETYSSAQKVMVDQYIMQGGSVLWLLDGVQFSAEALASKGQSATLKNETGLDDLLFSYGVRINADMVQDKQSLSHYFVTGTDINTSTLLPDYYAPLLMPSIDNPITKNIKDIATSYISTIDMVGKDTNTKKQILLSTSPNSKTLAVGEPIHFHFNTNTINKYFDKSFLPVAVSLEGEFASAYQNRMLPDSIVIHKRLNTSVHTKMIVVSSSSLIKNEVEIKDNIPYYSPMGWDRVSNKIYGNRDFIINATNWLTDDEGWMQVRNKTQIERGLDKQKTFEDRNKYIALNVIVPILFSIFILGSIFIYRRHKYMR